MPFNMPMKRGQFYKVTIDQNGLVTTFHVNEDANPNFPLALLLLQNKKLKLELWVPAGPLAGVLVLDKGSSITYVKVTTAPPSEFICKEVWV